MVIKNSEKNSARDHCDRFHLEKNNNLWSDKDNPHEPYQQEFTMVKKREKECINLLSLEWKSSREPYWVNITPLNENYFLEC